ncbi:unnamed protein product [Gongylonema pulchrum]|uniref:DUF2693 domain-containing protein n=1 Tax=Gongylonema pulchrum TaxID=637853 RepID=A0A183EPD2_9BILA|nr:unnamed protein product [Gongylonema pulchrum]
MSTDIIVLAFECEDKSSVITRKSVRIANDFLAFRNGLMEAQKRCIKREMAKAPANRSLVNVQLNGAETTRISWA